MTAKKANPEYVFHEKPKIIKDITTLHDSDLSKSIFAPAVLTMVRLASFPILLCSLLNLKNLHVDIPEVLS